MFSRVTIDKLFTPGIVKDVNGLSLALPALTDGNNICVRDGVLQKITGHSPIFGGVSCRPQWAVPYSDPAANQYLWIYAGIDDAGGGVIYSFDGSAHTSRTRSSGTYSVSSLIPWTGGVLNGVPVINPGLDTPQVWLRDAGGALNPTFEDMPTWPAGLTARVIRPYRQFLVAMDITDVSATPNRNPNKIMWSDAAAPFSVPDWTPTISNQAGDYDLAEGGELLVDALPMRDALIVYKDRSAWSMRYVGGQSIFSFQRVLSEHGLLAPRCVKAYKDGRHVAVTLGDVILHNGVVAESIASNRVRNHIFNDIDATNYSRSFLAVDYKENEFWFCYPTSGASLPNRAAIWNARFDSWTFRDLEEIAHLSYGVNDLSAALTWADYPVAWDSTTDVWGERSYNPVVTSLIGWREGATTAGSNVYQFNTGQTFDGANYQAFAERTGLAITGANERGAVIVDLGRRKSIRRVFFRLEGGPVVLRVGVAETPDGPYDWTASGQVTGDGEYKMDVRANGRFIGYRVESSGAVNWKLHGLAVEVRPAGAR